MERWEGGWGEEEEDNQQIMPLKYYQFKSSARVVRKYTESATKFSLKIHIIWDNLMYW